MQRVVNVNLNGNAYQLEEPAFDALRAYLDRAGAALAANPDKAEIVRDLEQAVADKCAAYLGAHKSVIGAEEMSRILEEMGPVAGEAAPGAEHAQSAPPPPGPGRVKRLYRIRDRGSMTGVSAGLGAYFDLDVQFIRVIWILGTLVTGGFLLVPYVVLMFVMPLATTPEEVAAGHGAPFNAQEVIERAKREYAEFTSADGPGGRLGRHARRAWRRAMRERARSWAHAWTPPPPPAGPIGYFGRVLAGLLLVVFSLVGAALTIAFVVAVISLATTGGVLGWAPPAGIPFWLAIVILALVFGAVSAPFTALRDASHAAVTGAPRYYGHGCGVFPLIVLALVCWYAYVHIPSAHAAIDGVNAQAQLWLRNTFPDSW
jgi:phage shock protein PspC (stress-responsive transcriptional regulator)